ncbi:HAD family hydrolase [Nonomuraea soli]|uniref:HAD superfamily hydrolase (TIGR01490 family) n=1 Tax=Nonomuraea soli TaxID=1032476 RepID=A0A7W0CHG8_9ACTN|nr:HAD-IB family hydrolase [Nonomuraea soli]MBA2891276.1 HAD superfamily hydrolase (TIGR01490 family) [Nonomuraea soli]
MRRLLRRRQQVEAEIAGEVAAAAAVATLPVAPDTQAAAFFDVDNTMMRGASIYHFARGLATRGMFSTSDLVKFAVGQAAFRLRGSENPEHIAVARETALAFVAGSKVEDVVRLGEEIYDEAMADRIWAGTRALAQAHLDAGQRVWLVTATPVELARVIAQRLGLTGALGTVAETADGVYTGRLVGDLLHGPAKAEAVRALARREGLDLTRCTAYSDSANDLPMLSLVGHAVAINPDSELSEHARKHDWPIKDYRTGRKATMIAIPVAAGAGVVAGGIAAALALRRHYRRKA